MQQAVIRNKRCHLELMYPYCLAKCARATDKKAKVMSNQKWVYRSTFFKPLVERQSGLSCMQTQPHLENLFNRLAMEQSVVARWEEDLISRQKKVWLSFSQKTILVCLKFLSCSFWENYQFIFRLILKFNHREKKINVVLKIFILASLFSFFEQFFSSRLGFLNQNVLHNLVAGCVFSCSEF